MALTPSFYISIQHVLLFKSRPIFCNTYQGRASSSLMLLFICHTFHFPQTRDQFCPLQRTSMQNILIIVHVTSSNINKNYKQYPVKLIILRNKNIILCNQVCIGRHRNFQSIPNTHQQSYTLVLLNNSYQWLHYGLWKDSP